MEIWEPKPPGTLWATPGLLLDCFTFFYINTGVLYGLLQRVTILDAVIIQFILLKMSIVLPETC